MNRSFQSVAALLVSLSGAMLAVTWIPSREPQPSQRHKEARRSAIVPCGFAIRGKTSPAASDRAWRNGLKPAAPALPDALSPQQEFVLDAGWRRAIAAVRETGGAIADSQAARSLAAALHGLRPLWPLGLPADGTGATAEEAERRRIEAEYAAAELAASRPAAAPLVSPQIEQGVACLASGLESFRSRRWLEMAAQMRPEFVKYYEQITVDYQWVGLLDGMLDHVRREHRRLVLREALLKELDRRFLDSLLEPGALPEKPRYRSPGGGRKLMLAAADALELLSNVLDEAAERLKTASRLDVAELNTPVENSEEKR